MSTTPVKVLLVEDDEDDMVLTRQLLRDIDPDAYDVQWIADFDLAMQRLVEAGYDVCLVDYRMGAHNGVEFIEQAVERGAGAPIILLTGQGDRTIDVAAMNAGAADFLNKGQLSPSLLERSIRYSIQQKKSEQQRVRLLMEQAARAEAVAENRAKDQFLAVLSHELRTPLSAVLLGAAALEQDPSIAGKSREIVGVVKRNVELEARLIDDLLDLTRITRGKIELRQEVVDLHRQIEYAVHDGCAADIKTKNLTVELACQAREHYVWGDATRLQQVLWNLLKNAVKFTPEGGVIRIRTGDAAPGRMFIEVEDTGIGIRAAALPRIFNAFEQADRSVTRRFGGLGLGLAICQAMVQFHGGTISARSPGENHGSVFRIELPVTLTRPASPAAGDDDEAQIGGTGVSILLVEDHADTAALMQRLLETRGYVVCAATSVAEALDLAKPGQFQLLISDIGLPDGSGLDLMRQLRSGMAIKGIALSGFGMEEDVERSRNAGFSEHLTKPVSMNDLQAAIQRVAQPKSAAPATTYTDLT